MRSERECVNCKFAAFDPDGPYCGHPKSFEQTEFGRGFNAMRNGDPDTAVCGVDGKLFESRKDT